MSRFLVRTSTAVAVLGLAAIGCSDDDGPPTGIEDPEVVLANHSVTPALIKGFPAGVTAYSLIGSDDVLSGSPSFVFGGSADGAGLLRNPDGTFTMLVNHEDNFAVSRIQLDKTFKPVSGDYVVNSTAGKYRLCSATLVTPAEHGFGPVFLTAGESSEESQILSVNPAGSANTPTYLTGLGRWNTENVVPLPKQAYTGKTVMLLGDDDSGQYGGQVALYVTNTIGDLESGSIYVLARTNDVTRERDMVVGQTYPVQFRRIENHKTLTGREINVKSADLKSVQFGRVEDIDYRKGGTGREVYLNVTGQATTGVNADFSRTKYGRVYRLTLDAADPLKGTLEVLLDGDDRSGPARQFQNPDNIFVGQNYVYIQEDDNGYGDEAHDAYIYQYNIASKEVKVVAELDHRRTATDAAKYNASGARPFAGWEYGALIDVSEQLGIDNTFLLSVQPHSWRAEKYKAVDGGSVRPNEDQASQILVIRGLPR